MGVWVVLGEYSNDSKYSESTSYCPECAASTEFILCGNSDGLDFLGL